MRYQVVMVFKGRQDGLAREVRLGPQFQGVFPVGRHSRARPLTSLSCHAFKRRVRAQTEWGKQGCQLLVSLDVIAGHKASIRRVCQRAGLTRLLGVTESQDLVQVVDIACETLGSLAVEDVGTDRALFGRNGRAGEDLLRVQEGQVSEPGQDACQARRPLPLRLACFPGVCLFDGRREQRVRFGGTQESFGGVEPDGGAGRALAAGWHVGDWPEREPSPAQTPR